MPHGLPDGTLTGLNATIFSLFDVGELAARLGSPIIYDRRGNVLWFDDFEGGLRKWEEVHAGVAGTVRISANYPLSGAYSLFLQAAANDDAATWVERWCYYTVPGGLGLEAAFSLIAGSGDFEMDFWILGKPFSLYPEIRYKESGQILYYRDAGYNWVELASGLNLRKEWTCFHHLKLVIDNTTKKYVRLLLDNVEYDMSALALYQAASTVGDSIKVRIRQRGLTAGCDPLYVDDIILTQNEV